MPAKRTSSKSQGTGNAGHRWRSNKAIITPPSAEYKSTYKKPKARLDGEMYPRPFPNPFTPEWMAGYNDGFDSKPYAPLIAGGLVQNYRDGYVCGQEAFKEHQNEMDHTGSSNA